jgi:hypothetical protein
VGFSDAWRQHINSKGKRLKSGSTCGGVAGLFIGPEDLFRQIGKFLGLPGGRGPGKMSWITVAHATKRR